MSNLGLQMSPERPPRARRHRAMSGLAVLASLAVVALLAFGVKLGIEHLPSFGSGPPDFEGQGTESVVITVNKGDTLAEIGRTLKSEGVVASVDAWLDQAKQEPATAKIGPGQYDMLTEMSAAAAVARMVDPASRVSNKLLLREGLRFNQSIAAISKATGISKKKLVKASKSGDIGLPKYADDNAEGYLFPATYELEKNESATKILTRLVDRWHEAADKLDLNAGAKKLGYSPYEIMIIASLIQAEGHPDDYAKIARVIYNRLDPDTWGETYGFLQLDTALNYALDNTDLVLTNEQVQNTDTPFNLYKYPGLPPTPINSPGEAAIEAALNPVEGDWLWYVTVDPDTGQTKFTDDYNQFLQFKDEFSKWLEEHPQ